MCHSAPVRLKGVADAIRPTSTWNSVDREHERLHPVVIPAMLPLLQPSLSWILKSILDYRCPHSL